MTCALSQTASAAPLTLRPYQQAAVEAVYAYLRDNAGNPCVVIPTAGGKTPIIATLCRDAALRWNGRVLVLAHVKELLQQTADTLGRLAPDVPVGLYSAGLGRRDTDCAVLVAGIQSVYQRAEQLGPFDLILVDEAHLIPPDGDGRYQTFLADAQVINPDVRLIGLTATPFRMTSGWIYGQGCLFDQVCFEVSVRELIAQGYLCPLKSKSARHAVDTACLSVRGGEFIAEQVEDLMDTERRVASACAEILEYTANRNSVLIFAAGVSHARHIQHELARQSGQEVGLITGEMPAEQRDALIARFKGQQVCDMFGQTKPRLKFLVNVNVLTTGFDAPGIDGVALLRPTNSPGLYYQMVGRGFRLHPDKTDCLVLDFGGNILRHGPVDALQVKSGASSGSGGAPAKLCPACQSVIHAAYSVCPDCGHLFPEPQRQTHQPTASAAGILSDDIQEIDYPVLSVRFSRYTKKDASPDHPPTLRVEYELGFRNWHSEWVCFEHSGFARAKADTWWKARSNEPAPDTVQQALELIQAGALAETVSITVRHIPGQKFPKIIDYRLGPKPPRLDGSDERDDGNLPEYQPCYDDDIPF